MCTFITCKILQCGAFTLFVDSTPARVRHASVYDDSDPDSGNTISQSVAMAIAGSPLPHVKANPLAVPTVVSDNSWGQVVPRDTRQVTDLTLRGSLLPQSDRTPHWSFCNQTKKNT